MGGLSADNQGGDCPQTIGVSVRRRSHGEIGLSADNQRGGLPADNRESVRRHSTGGLSADNRGECPQTLKEGTVRKQSTVSI